MDEDGFIVDDILNAKTAKKKINCGSKGKRVERDLVKLFNEQWGESFSRTVGSGNRWSQVSQLPKHAQDTFSGDLVTPENFLFVVECKGGYDDVDLNSVFVGGHGQIDDFLEQAAFECQRCGKKPMLVWKKNRKPWVAALRTEDLPHLNWEYRLVYRNWSLVALEELFTLGKEFFFRH